MNKSLTLVFLALVALTAILAPAAAHAAPPAQFGGTQVTITNPVNGMTLPPGLAIGIQSTSTGPGGIAFVQLFVDNVFITSNSPPNGLPVPNFTVVQPWTTTPGYHTITVKATTSQGVTGQASIFVNVTGNQPPPGPTRTPNPCIVGMRFLGDLTYPDGSVINPGTPFQKVWQVQNTGTCIWINTYSLLNVGGGSFGAPSPAPIPETAPGQTVNLSVNMTAPQQPGNYRSVWQLRLPNGITFGTQIDAAFTVPQAGCNGVPQITQFIASPSIIQRGQSTTLIWGQVFNSDQVRLQTPAGSSSVQAPGQTVLAPQATTTYFLSAFCKGQRVDNPVVVTVTNPQPPTPTPPPFQQNFIRLSPAQQAGFGAINVPVTYFYDNTGAPGNIQLTAYNNFGQIVGTATVGAIPFSQQSPTITISVPSGYQNAVNVQGCITDRTGNLLTCGTGLGIR